MIPNHVTPRLSDLDLQIARSVPPGGNWRDVPEWVPSARLAQIRASAARGEGSRSTYYGRLHPDRASYTINTYYNRPGNGCFLHYEQHRTLSHREAARLQSFPDDFQFSGPQRAICQQIGNAVPPLLAFQIARMLGRVGATVDVFSGAGGLSLGFKWAGWRSVCATDIDRYFAATFNANVEPVAFVGDMSSDDTLDRLCHVAQRRASERLALLGGPPCQGFSTGGNRRDPNEARNGLHARYAELVKQLKPDVFIFENVLGLLSMERGAFVERIRMGLRTAGYDVTMWRLRASDFGVPQRRDRVFLVGVPLGRDLPLPPVSWANFGDKPVSRLCTVEGALNDLPSLEPGQDGSELEYVDDPRTPFQQLMRGCMTPEEFVFGGGAVDSDRSSSALQCVTAAA